MQTLVSNVNNGFISRVKSCFTKSINPSVKTIKWLLSLMIPISFVVMLLDYSGVLLIISGYTGPLMSYFGLSGQTALVLLSGGLINIYSALAVISTIDITMRELTILSVMILIAHNLIIETAVQKKTGSAGYWMLLLRIIAAITAGLILNIVLPANAVILHASTKTVSSGFWPTIVQWLTGTLQLTGKVVIIIVSLNFLQKLLDEFSITLWLSKFLTPFLRAMGLPLQASFLWLIANVIGLTWGSAVLIEQTREGKISRREANILNHHIAISHSLLEDTLLFVAIGVPVIWLIMPRLILAFVVVWLLRAYLVLFKK